jgi:hypothetical protein
MQYKLPYICIWTIWWLTVTITCLPLLQNQEIIENHNNKMHLNQDMVNYSIPQKKIQIVTIYILLYLNI